ncbi:MAG: FtsK/SpoIIIE domain-containing protein, partial [Actinomycetes bacterium]
MRILLRLSRADSQATVPPLAPALHSGATDSHDVEVEAADDLSVGELATALAPYVGLESPSPLAILTSRGELHADSLVAQCGPTSGSEVRVVVAGSHPPSEATPPSPVALVDAAGHRAPMPFGTTILDDAAIDVTDVVTVRRYRPGLLSVNGTPLAGAIVVEHGDLLRTASGVRTVVRSTAPSLPPTHGAHTALRSSPPWTLHGEPQPTAPITLPAPPAPTRTPRLPTLTAIVPLCMAIGVWWSTKSLSAATFVLFSVVFLLAAAFESRREARAERAFRVAEFHRALEACRSAISERIATLQAHAHAEHPHVADRLPGTAAASQLWGRTDLAVRLGVGPVRVEGVVSATPRSPSTDPLSAATHELLTTLDHVDLPIIVDLEATGGLAVIGNPQRAQELIAAVLVQLATAHAPEDLGLHVDPTLDWAKWLPHVPAHPAARHHVRVTTHPDARPSATEHLVWWGPTHTPPAGVGAVVTLADDHLAVLRRHGHPDCTLTIEGLAARACESAARSLTPLVRVGGDARAQHSNAVSLRDIVTDTDGAFDGVADVHRRWQASAGRDDLAAPVATLDGARWCIDLRADGPHVLVAGTTGSGKSEFLRTLVVSLALHHDPQRCTFLLVDYKGGAAFGALNDLPHVVGTVTDLDATTSRRALRALRAELHHRERVAASGATPPPALVVVIDEFATLVRE